MVSFRMASMPGAVRFVFCASSGIEEAARPRAQAACRDVFDTKRRELYDPACFERDGQAAIPVTFAIQ